VILVQVADLIERSRVDCGLPAYSTGTNITSAMILDFVKRSAQKLAGLIQQQGADQQYFTLTTTLTTSAGVAQVSLPANSLDVVRIAKVTSNGEIMLCPADLGEWDPTPGYIASSDLDVPRYSVQGNAIVLFPTPVSVYDLRVYYTSPFTVVTTADYLSIGPSWDEWIVASCNVMIRNRQKESAQEFTQSLGLAEAAIVSQLRRDRAGPRQIRDVRAPVFDYGGRPRVGRWW
jgi:hypothetical protein